MTASRWGRSPKEFPALAMLLLVPPITFATLWAAAGRPSSLSALAVASLPLVLAVVVFFPAVSVGCLAGLIMANAGLVLQAEGVPNVVRLATLLAAAGLFARYAARERMLGWTPVLLAFAVFAVVRILSAFVAPDGADTYDAAKILVFGALIIIVVTGVTSGIDVLRGIAAAIVATASVLVILSALKLNGIGDTFGGFAADVVLGPERLDDALRSLQPPTDDGRVSGPLGDPNFWAQSLLVALPLALWLARDARSRAGRLAAVAATGVIGVGIISTQSRGGLIALFVGVSAFVWLVGGRARLLLAVLPIVVAGVLATSDAGSRFEQLRDLAQPREAVDPSIRGRLSEDLAAVEMFSDHPLIGLGAGQYTPHYAQYATRIGLDERREREPHNSYLEMAAESGVLGLAAFLGLLGTMIVTSLRSRARLVRNGELAAGHLAEALIAAMLGYGIAAVFLHQAFPEYLWLLLGLAAGVWTLSARGGHGAPYRGGT